MQKSKNYWKELDTKGKLKYFVQYYKWPTIGILCGLLFVVITFSQLGSVTKTDYILMIVGEKEIGISSPEVMMRSLASFAGENLGGTKKTGLTPAIKLLAYTNNDYPDVDQGNDVQLSVQTQLGNSLIFIVSPSEYQRLSKNLGYPFKNLSNYTDKMVEGKNAVLFSDTKFAGLYGFQSIPSDYLVCALNKKASVNSKKAQKIQGNTEIILKLMLKS